jgi:hypothetical protein
VDVCDLLERPIVFVLVVVVVTVMIGVRPWRFWLG